MGDWGIIFATPLISIPVAPELTLPEIRRRHCRVPTLITVGTRHVQSPPSCLSATVNQPTVNRQLPTANCPLPLSAKKLSI